MKKLIILGALAVLSGCADLSQYGTADANASAKTKMRACMVAEANVKLQNGTLFAQSLSATSDEIVNTCIKKLALQAAGIREESQSAAQNIISNLRNLGNN